MYKECQTKNTYIGGDLMIEKVKLDVSNCKEEALVDTHSDGL